MLDQTVLSERRACRLAGLSRDAFRHPPVPTPATQALSARIIELAQIRRRFGYRRLHDLLRPEFPDVNHKKVYRLYSEASLAVRRRKTRVNEPSVDVIAHKDHLGIEPPIIKVQVKSSPNTVTDKDVSALYGKLSHGEYGLFVTLGSYSPSCRNFEQGKGNLRLIDGDELVDLIFAHYEQFDSRHKGLLPLRRIYVPQVLEAD